VKRLLAAGIAATAMVAVLPTPAGADSQAQQVTKLERRVAKLEKANKSLTKKLTETRQIALGAAAIAFCDSAITADALQATWTTVNSALGRTVFATSAAVGDGGLCNALQVSRPAAVPPTISPFEQLLRGLGANTTVTGALSAVFR
jgi:hypothetical protein